MKVGDLVSKKITLVPCDEEDKIIYGIIVGIEASEAYVKIHWFGDYGSFWTNIHDMELGW